MPNTVATTKPATSGQIPYSSYRSMATTPMTSRTKTANQRTSVNRAMVRRL